MRILQLISSNGFYGAEGVVLNLCSGLRDLGCDVTLALFNTGRPQSLDFEAAAQRLSIDVWNLTCKGRFDPGAVVRLGNYLRKTKTDVIHTHGYKANLYGYLSSQISHCHRIATCHNWTNRTAALNGYARADKFLLRRFDRVAAVSQNVHESLRQSGLPEAQLKLISNGIDTARFRPETGRAESGEQITIGVLSRLSVEKGLDVLIRALPKVLQQYPRVSCVIRGEGPERNRLTVLAQELGVDKAICLSGFCADTAEFLTNCSIIAHPSRMEGMPLAILEAMAARRPIVASKVGGIPTLLDHGNAGILVEPGDPDVLADALLSLLADPALRERLAVAAQSRAQHSYDSSVMAQSYLDLCRELDEVPDSFEGNRVLTTRS